MTHLYNIINKFPKDECLCVYSVHHQTMWSIYGLIKDHTVFKRTGTHSQVYIEFQLLVFLYRLGSMDQGFLRISSRVYISVGTCVLYFNRVKKSILSLTKSTIVWPDVEERACISKRILATYGLFFCVGISDGTLLFLKYRPTLYGEYFNTRKGGYVLNCLLVCDDTCRILGYYCGFTGSTHNNRVWTHTKWYKDPSDFFSQKQYLVAGSAFVSGPHMVPSFKVPHGLVGLPTDKSLFNTKLTQLRIKVEHCIGILKNRFLYYGVYRWLSKTRKSGRQQLNY